MQEVIETFGRTPASEVAAARRGLRLPVHLLRDHRREIALDDLAAKIKTAERRPALEDFLDVTVMPMRPLVAADAPRLDASGVQALGDRTPSIASDHRLEHRADDLGPILDEFVASGLGPANEADPPRTGRSHRLFRLSCRLPLHTPSVADPRRLGLALLVGASHDDDRNDELRLVPLQALAVVYATVGERHDGDPEAREG